MNAAQSTLPSDMEPSRRHKYVEELAPDAINDWPKLCKALVEDLVTRDKLAAFVYALYQDSNASSELVHILNGTVNVDVDGKVNAAALQSINNKVKPYFNAEEFSTWLKAMMPCVCAIWVDDGLDDPGIRGTGFLIAPDLVLTARHVVVGLINAIATGVVINNVVQVNDQQQVGSAPKLCCVFDYRTIVSKFERDTPPPECIVVDADTDWLVWSSLTDARDGYTHNFAGNPSIATRLDCAVIRLATPIGIKADARRGGKMRGWLQLNGSVPVLRTQEIITILQHPQGLPQNFSMNEFCAQDPTTSRIWYDTNTDHGSSGSPCFDRNLDLIAFHNAGRPKNFQGATQQCNQGVRIDHVISALPAVVTSASRNQPPADIKLWSLSTNLAAPRPVLGREDFKEMALNLMQPDVERRLIVVDDADDVKGIGKSGKSFSAELLKALARGRSVLIVEFEAKELRSMGPDAFLREIGRRIGIDLPTLDTAPPRPNDERQWTRWWANDLPHWFGDLLEQRAAANGTANTETAGENEWEAATATGQKVMLRELLWIVIDNVHRYPPEGAMKELLAGMMAITDTDQALGAGLRSLRWLTIGHVPDFVRERSIEYLRDTVSQDDIDGNAWIKCVQTAFESEGAGNKFDESMARSLYELVEFKQATAVRDRATRIRVLGGAIIEVMNQLFKTAGIA
ncbi:trypsin-like serine peptidase [Pseudomonas fluorescens group sp. PF-1]